MTTINTQNPPLLKGMKKTREDLGFLMRQLETMLNELGLSHLAEQLPWLREDSPAHVVNMDRQLVQAYSLAFQLLNMVEENASNQLRRSSETVKGKSDWRGLWAYQLQKLKEANYSAAEIAENLHQSIIEPVLTAHPTEAKRITIIEHHRELYLLLVKRENPMWTPTEQRELEESIKSILERLWRTGEVYLQKPSVESERASLEHYLHNVFPESIRRMDFNLREAWRETGFNPSLIDRADALPKIAFGTWVGGDRDGHPLVTPRVTEESLHEYRLRALVLVKNHLEALRHKLSISDMRCPAPQKLLDRLSDCFSLIGQKAEILADRNPGETWRQYLSFLIERLPLAWQSSQTHELTLATRFLYTYHRAEELIADLEILRDSLLEVHAHRIVNQDLDPVIRLLHIFGFHLVAVDIRQNSGFHDKAIGQILQAIGEKDCDFGNWDEEKRIAFLDTELRCVQPKLRSFALQDNEAELAVGAYAVVARYIRNFGSAGIGAFILSMTRSVSDLLAVNLIAREAGLLHEDEEGAWCPVPVVPLFETVGDLEAAPQIMKRFLTHPVTQNSLKHQKRKTVGACPIQQVMIGYSDSNKDQGIVASQWTLHYSQRAIVAVAKELGVDICFFHGRGGTISRGAGPTDRFLEALPAGSLGSRIRMTEQGETIAYKYSNLVTATYHLELLAAGAHRYSLQKKSPLEPELEPILDQLVDYSGAHYRDLLKTEGFIDFYREATPIDALEQSRIGSRPSRRTGTKSLDDLRAIPWVFSWSQARFFLPGWYGTGSGLEQLQQNHPQQYKQLISSVRESPFLHYLFTNIEESVASTDRELFTAYAGLVKDSDLRERFLDIIVTELNTLQKHLAAIFKKPLIERRPYFSHTLALRDQALRPLHHYQIEKLAQWRTLRDQNREAEIAEILPELLLSISSIASGIKTTG